MSSYEIVFTDFLCDVLCKKQRRGESEECVKNVFRIVDTTGCGDRLKVVIIP